ncbi:hypothetical protein V8F06_013330 [Rhypophila decipiens]
MSSSTTKVLYKEPCDWEAWSNQFIKKAKDHQLWRYIDPERREAWPEEPDMPYVGHYTREETTEDRQLRLTALNTAIQARRSNQQTRGDEQDDDGPPVPPNMAAGNPRPDTPQSRTVRRDPITNLPNETYTLSTLPPLQARVVGNLSLRDQATYNNEVMWYKEFSRRWELHNKDK